MSNNVFDYLEIRPGTHEQYKTLSQYHYIPFDTGPTTSIYVAVGKDRSKSIFPDPVAVHVFRMPLPCLTARNKITQGFFQEPPTKSEKLKRVNKYIRYAARIIVHPNFRKLGIASWLIKNTLSLPGVSIIEALAPIHWTGGLFRAAGFTIIRVPDHQWYARLRDVFFNFGLTEQSLNITQIVHQRISALNKSAFEVVDYEIKRFISHYRHETKLPHNLNRTEQVLTKLFRARNYLYWENPEIPWPHEKSGKQHYSTLPPDRIDHIGYHIANKTPSRLDCNSLKTTNFRPYPSIVNRPSKRHYVS